MDDSNGISVGELAQRAGVAVSAVHFYERKGLVQSWRNAGNQRRFAKDALRRIAVIKSAQRVGISLQEIQAAMSTLPATQAPNKKDWARLSKRWRADLDERIRHLHRLRDELDGCIGCGCLSLKACPLRNPNDIAAEQGEGAPFLMKTALHFRGAMKVIVCTARE